MFALVPDWLLELSKTIAWGVAFALLYSVRHAWMGGRHYEKTVERLDSLEQRMERANEEMSEHSGITQELIWKDKERAENLRHIENTLKTHGQDIADLRQRGRQR